MTQTTTRPLAAPPTEPELAQTDGLMDAVGRAREAQPGWRATSPGERAGHLRAAASAVRAASDELGDLLCTTTGRLLGEARDSARVAAELLDEAAVAGLVGGRALAGGPGALDLVRTEPRG
ncbi:MAG: aldehyde dehydrogenase family protein, partial [Ornithinibacter sp.]